MIRLIVGLGNPGPKYAGTRHNAGVWALAEWADEQALTFREEPKFSGRTATLTLGGASCWLLLPSVFMNESGRSVLAMANFYKIAPEEILVAHDELDFPAGVIRLKAGGGHGGHNGLRDIIRCLGSAEFLRLRIGIGHPGHKDHVLNYVLGEPSLHDKTKIIQSIETVFPLIPDLLTGDLDRAFRSLHNLT
jgi:peptidyl-tRNA hydrolase, PTH1 family